MSSLTQGSSEPASPSSPALSIVIASVNGYFYIAQALRSLAKLRRRDQIEVIVVEGSDDDAAIRIAAEFPWIRLYPMAEPRPIPELRAIGFRHARGAIVATTEDHCVFDEEWGVRMLEAHAKSELVAIGGAVENGSDRYVDWGAYICEYGKFMLPFPAERTADLAAPNVSYKRAALEGACRDLLDENRAWESTLHGRLLERGLGLGIDPSIVVYHSKYFEFWDFLTQRYYFGRTFAAARVASAPRKTRAFFTAISLFLPPLFLLRYAKHFIGKRRFVMELVKTSPLLVLFAVAWSVGEFFGYAFGDGGASLKVK